MKLRIIYGTAGTGKSDYCYNEIAKLIDNEKKIYIITPEQFSFTAEKKLLDKVKDGATFNAEVITFSRMAYRIINEVGGEKSVGITKTGKAMLVYSILNTQKNNLKFLSKSDDNIDICLNAISEFKKHGISVLNLKEEMNNMKSQYLKTKLKDITTIYEQFEERISGKYIDDTDLLSILAEKIDKTDMFKDSLIYIDEFSGFTNQEYEIIKKLLVLAKCVTVTMCTDSLSISENPDIDVFSSNKLAVSKIIKLVQNRNDLFTIKLENKKRFKNEELKHLSINLYENKYKRYSKFVKNIKIFLAKNQYSEIENVAKEIVKKVRDEKYRYRDIAIITKNIDIYSSQIRAIFSKYDIPVFIDAKRELSQNSVIQYVLALLEIFSKNWSYDAIFNYLKTGFTTIENDDIFKLEKYCAKWGIKHNKWTKEFKYGIENESKQIEIEHIEKIRQKLINPLITLKADMYKEKDAKNMSKHIYQFLINDGFEERLKRRIDYLENIGAVDVANEYKESYSIFINILDEIYNIFGEDNLTFEEFVSILKIGFKNSGLGKIPQVADQVIVGDVDRSRSHRVKSIYIIGLNDGIFPSINKDEGFLNDSDREVLKEDGIELAKGTIDRLYEDNYNIYKAFSTAEETLYVSYASSDQDGKSMRPSILISKIKRIFPKLLEDSDIIRDNSEILTQTTTFEELINNINRIRCGEAVDKIWFSVYRYYFSADNWKNKFHQSLKGLEYTNIPEPISKENINKLYGNIINTSVSKLEKYRSCPFSYYLQYGLRLSEKEEFKIQSINTGTFMHETIDKFFSTVREQGLNLDDITLETINQIVNNIIDEELSLNKNYVFIASAKYKLLVVRLKRIVAKALKYIIETLIQSKFDILGTEIEFGKKGKYKPIILNLDNGKKVEIIGKIDRVDIGKNEDGKYLRIIDYKSSTKNIDFNEIYAGLQIQLLTYMDAVCREEDAMAAGVLYFSLIEQIVKSERHMEEDEIEEKIKTNFRMKGLILADIKVVKMHDKTLSSGASKLVPAYIDKSGNLSKKTNSITKEQFTDLQKYINKTIKEIAREMLEGNIDLKPYYKKGNTPCKYCTYRTICGFNVGFCNNDYNYISNESKENILEKIKRR